jgi:hypothetical protein
MNTINRDYDEILRRALHAAADSVEPSADGLERIRARLRPQPLLSVASAIAWYSEAATRITAWVAPVLRSILDAFWSVIDRFRPAERAPGEEGPRFGWLRPMAAMGTAIFVVAAGAFAIMTLPQAINSSGSISIFPWTEHHPGNGGGSGASNLNGNGSTAFPPGVSSPGVPRITPVTSPAASQCSAVGNLPTGSATPAPSTSPSKTPTPPASSSPPVSSTPTPTPTPTPSTTPPPTQTTAPPTGSSTPDPGSVTTPSAPATPAVPVDAVLGAAASTGPGTAADHSVEGVLMRPSRSLSPAPFSPCPSSSPKKKNKSTAPPLGALGITGYGITEQGITEQGGTGTTPAAGESARNY